MAKIQKQFDQFDESICLGEYEENQMLREKRDIVREKVDSRLPDIFRRHGEVCPPKSWRDQGSYEMGTGVKPLDSDYDIDQGLYFEVSTDQYSDPVVLKQRVHEALDGHTDSVRIRRPCVTVQYHRNKEPLYHVDIAVYADSIKNVDGKDRISMGRENSAADKREWKIADPEGLTRTIFTRFDAGSDRAQFRRVVRYLKRWKDYNFSSDGHAAPKGIGLTVAAYDDLRVTYSDPISRKPDDLSALRDLVRAMTNRFSDVYDTETNAYVRRLVVKLPVEPWSDLFDRMSANQMKNFEDTLITLRDALDAAADDIDPTMACERLRKVFGDDFPVPAREESAKKHAQAVASSSNSG